MRSLILLLALGACSPVVNLPVETGAPARPLPASVVVTAVHVDLSTLLGMSGHRLGSAIRSGDQCVVLLPKPEQVSPVDYTHIRAHELRHCAGQDHTTMALPTGRNMIVWLP